jgi:hypothetical protein
MQPFFLNSTCLHPSFQTIFKERGSSSLGKHFEKIAQTFFFKHNILHVLLITITPTSNHAIDSNLGVLFFICLIIISFHLVLDIFYLALHIRLDLPCLTSHGLA